MIRIKDIAEKVGVSPTTVSNVIHGNTKKVSREMIEKVEAVIQEMNYVPSMGARMLAGKHSNIVGVLVGHKREHESLKDPFIGEILGEIEMSLFERGYFLMMHISHSSEENIRLASAWNVDGLITIGVRSDDNIRICKNMQVPLVSVDNYYKNGQDGIVPNVGLDDFEGGCRMASHLIELGYEHIVFLADNSEGGDYQRFCGVKATVEQIGKTGVNSTMEVIPNNAAERSRYYKALIERIKKKQVLFFASDYYAADALRFFAEQGISVPGDVGVAGFDNNEYATLCIPSLTTVNQNVKEKGRTAVDKLVALIHKEQVEWDTRLPVRLVKRNSVEMHKNDKKMAER